MRFRDWDKNLKIRLYILIVYGMMYWMFYPFMLIFFQDSIEKWLLGIFLSISSLLTAVVSFFSGYLSDTFGRKKMMTIGQFLQGVGILFMAISFPIGDLLHLDAFSLALLVFIGFTLIGISGALYYPASNAMITDVVEDEDRSKVFTVFYTFININVTVGPLIGSLFVENYLFEFLIVMTIVTIYLTYVTATKIRETLDLKLVTRRKLRVEIKEQFKSYRLVLKDKIFLLLMFYGFLTGLAFNQFFSLVPLSIENSFKNYRLFNIELSTENLYSIIVFQNGLMIVLLAVIINKIVERYHRKYAFIISAVFYMLAMFIYGYASGLQNALVFFIVGNALATFGEVTTVGVNTAFLAQLAPDNKKATYFAANDLFSSIWRSIYPLVITLSGIIGSIVGSDKRGNMYTFFIIGFITISAIILPVYMFKMYEKRKKANVRVVNNHEIKILD